IGSNACGQGSNAEGGVVLGGTGGASRAHDRSVGDKGRSGNCSAQAGVNELVVGGAEGGIAGDESCKRAGAGGEGARGGDGHRAAGRCRRANDGVVVGAEGGGGVGFRGTGAIADVVQGRRIRKGAVSQRDRRRIGDAIQRGRRVIDGQAGTWI